MQTLFIVGDVFQIVLEYLSLKDVCNLRLVNKEAELAVTSANIYWKTLFESSFPTTQILKVINNDSWKMSFFAQAKQTLLVKMHVEGQLKGDTTIDEKTNAIFTGRFGCPKPLDCTFPFSAKSISFFVKLIKRFSSIYFRDENR